jgi:hypothetical protein
MPRKKAKKAKKLGLSPVLASASDPESIRREKQDRDVYNICWNDDWLHDNVTFKQFREGNNALFLFHQRQYPSDEARQLDVNIFATDLDGKLTFLGYTRKTGNAAIARGAIAMSVQIKNNPIQTNLLDTVEDQYAPPDEINS